MATSTATPSRTAADGGGGRSLSRQSAAKVTVADQISQAVQSTSNLIHLMQHSSPSQDLLAKLPKNLLSKVSTINHTGQVLEQLPHVISSLDADVENGVRSVPHLKTVIQLLENMETCQLSSLAQSQSPQEVHDKAGQTPVSSSNP